MIYKSLEATPAAAPEKGKAKRHTK
jgi:hypothetical protein